MTHSLIPDGHAASAQLVIAAHGQDLGQLYANPCAPDSTADPSRFPPPLPALRPATVEADPSDRFPLVRDGYPAVRDVDRLADATRRRSAA